MLKVVLLAAGSAVLGLGPSAAQTPRPPPASAYIPPVPPVPSAPLAPVATSGNSSIYQYTGPDGRHVTVITDGRNISPAEVERIRSDAMAQAARARELNEEVRRSARLSAEQARRMAEDARRQAEISREQVMALRNQALADAGRALREVRVYGDGFGRQGFASGASENAKLRAEVEALRNDLLQLRREVESLRRGR